MSAVREYWRNLTLVLLAVLLVFLSFKTGLDAGMASGRIDPSWRYRIYAVPIVLSQIYYGRAYDYVGYNALAIPFQAEQPSIDALVSTLKSVAGVESQGLFFILADDKGTVDVVRLAFLLYGIATASLYYMYFTIFLVSCLLYAVSYFTDRHKLALLVFLCLAFYATMPAFLAFPPGINILDTHAFGMLSLAAFLHLLVAATDPNPTRPLGLATVVAQALILILVYHTRSSTMTQVLAVLVAGPLIVYLSRRRDRSPVSLRRRLAPVAIVLVAICLLPLYQRLRYHPDYFTRRSTLQHIVYHNLLIGLQWNPALTARYGLGSGDLGAARAVDTYLETRTTRNPGRKNWAASGLNSVTTQLQFDWVEYEEAARDLYFTIWKEDPKECLRTIVYWHPVDVYAVLQVYLGNSTHPAFDKRYAYNPFGPVYLLVLVAATLLCTTRHRPMSAAHVLIALIMLASALVVPIVVYAGGFIILAESFVSAGLLVYATLGVVLSALASRALGRFRVPVRPRTATAVES